MLSVSTSCNLFNFHKLSYQNADQNTRGKTTGKFPKQLRHLATFTCVDDRLGRDNKLTVQVLGACVLHIGVLAIALTCALSAVFMGGALSKLTLYARTNLV